MNVDTIANAAWNSLLNVFFEVFQSMNRFMTDVLEGSEFRDSEGHNNVKKIRKRLVGVTILRDWIESSSSSSSSTIIHTQMQSKSGHDDPSLQYVGHSGKAYMLVEKKSSTTLSHHGSPSSNTQMVKCSIRLKEGKSLLVKKQSEHTLTFKITPFTCAKYTVLSSGVQRVLVSVSELSVNESFTTSSTVSPSSSSAKQSYFVPELQFIFGSEE